MAIPLQFTACLRSFFALMLVHRYGDIRLFKWNLRLMAAMASRLSLHFHDICYPLFLKFSTVVPPIQGSAAGARLACVKNLL